MICLYMISAHYNDKCFMEYMCGGSREANPIPKVSIAYHVQGAIMRAVLVTRTEQAKPLGDPKTQYTFAPMIERYIVL
jgi:hypothetical protein